MPVVAKKNCLSQKSGRAESTRAAAPFRFGGIIAYVTEARLELLDPERRRVLDEELGRAGTRSSCA